MSGRFSGTAVVDRPIAEVFAFLEEGTNDPKFSPRVLSIRKEPEGPSDVGTLFISQVKDAGMKTDRTFELTEVEAPTTIRWTELSKNLVTAEGGYDLEDLGGLAPVDPPTTFGFSSTPRGPSVTTVATTVELPTDP